MKKKLLKFVLIGFFLGVAFGNLIEIVLSVIRGSGELVFPDPIVRITSGDAQALALQVLFSGLFGAISVGGSIFYEIEEWSMAKTMALHYLTIFASYLLIGSLLGWIVLSLVTILIIAGIMAVVYFTIWLIMYLKHSSDVRELNEMLRKEKHGT